MVWYYGGDMTRALDRLRMRIGNTEISQPLLQDEELNWVLSEQPDERLAAADACDLIAARLAKRVDVSLAGQSASLTDKFQAYRDLASTLRTEAGRRGGPGGMTVGALLVIESTTLQQQADVKPAFWRNQFGHPGVDQSGPLAE